MAVSILVVRGLLEALEQSGVTREHFLAVSGFEPARLENPDERISLSEYDALHELGLDLTGDEGFGLRMGELASATTYNLVAHLVAHAGTLRQAIDALIRFHRLVIDRPAWQLTERDTTATLAYALAPGSTRCRRFRAECAISAATPDLGWWRSSMLRRRTLPNTSESSKARRGSSKRSPESSSTGSSSAPRL
jgi:hypothetical protein